MDKNIKDILKAFLISIIFIMNESENVGGEKVRVKVSDIIKKFKTKQDIVDYCRENGNIYF